jgi:hypothetical protein
MSDFWTLNPRSTQIPLTYQYRKFNICEIHHPEPTPGVFMSIGHHHSVLFTIHEQSVTVRLDWEITLSAWLSLRFSLHLAELAHTSICSFEDTRGNCYIPALQPCNNTILLQYSGPFQWLQLCGSMPSNWTNNKYFIAPLAHPSI